MGMPFFLAALPFSGNKSNLCLSLHLSDWAYHWEARSDTMLFELHSGVLPAFPLNQQPYPHAAGQHVESDHLGNNGHKQASGLI